MAANHSRMSVQQNMPKMKMKYRLISKEPSQLTVTRSTARLKIQISVPYLCGLWILNSWSRAWRHDSSCNIVIANCTTCPTPSNDATIKLGMTFNKKPAMEVPYPLTQVCPKNDEGNKAASDHKMQDKPSDTGWIWAASDKFDQINVYDVVNRRSTMSDHDRNSRDAADMLVDNDDGKAVQTNLICLRMTVIMCIYTWMKFYLTARS